MTDKERSLKPCSENLETTEAKIMDKKKKGGE